MFNNKRRVDSAFAKGLMFGKAVGKRDERDRIIELLTALSKKLKEDDLSPTSAFAVDQVIVMIGQGK